jgi:hypothetical protein
MGTDEGRRIVPTAAIAVTRDHLTLVEVADKIRNLSDADCKKLEAIALLRSIGRPINHEDLLHEAYLRVLDGRRRCPRDVGIVKVLDQIMRSLASGETKTWSREHGQMPALRKTEDTEDVTLTLEYPTDNLSPEDHLLERERTAYAEQRFREFLASFYDPDAQKILDGLLHGRRGPELQGSMSATRYATLRTAIRRRIEQFAREIRHNQTER